VGKRSIVPTVCPGRRAGVGMYRRAVQARDAGGGWSRRWSGGSRNRRPAFVVVRLQRADAGWGRPAARRAIDMVGAIGARGSSHHGCATHGGKGRRCAAGRRSGRAVAPPSVVGEGAGATVDTVKRAVTRPPLHARRACYRQSAGKEALGVASLGGGGGGAHAAPPASVSAPRRHCGGPAAGGSAAVGAPAAACVGAPPRRPRRRHGRAAARGAPARGSCTWAWVGGDQRCAVFIFLVSRTGVPGSEGVAVNKSLSHAMSPLQATTAWLQRRGEQERLDQTRYPL